MTKLKDLISKDKINDDKALDNGLERYDESAGDNQKWVSIKKIIVETERDKEQLLKAFEYIHYLRDIDTDFIAVNTIAHIYQAPDLIEVKDKYDDRDE